MRVSDVDSVLMDLLQELVPTNKIPENVEILNPTRMLQTSHITPDFRRCYIPTSGPSQTDIAGLTSIKQKLQTSIQLPLTNPEAFQRFGLRPTRGILLYGPPGCSKTTLTRAIAKDYGLPFLVLDCANAYSPYVGESERQGNTGNYVM